MKNVVKYCLILLLFSNISCTSGEADSGGPVGVAMDTSGAVTVDAALAALGRDSVVECKVSGRVLQVCQGEGCWLTLEKSDGRELMVKTRDQSFHFPKDIADKRVFVQGTLHFDSADVAVLDAVGLRMR